jgi:hypothetical protein
MERGGDGGRSPTPSPIVEMNAIARDNNGKIYLVAVLADAGLEGGWPAIDCARWQSNYP